MVADIPSDGNVRQTRAKKGKKVVVDDIKYDDDVRHTNVKRANEARITHRGVSAFPNDLILLYPTTNYFVIINFLHCRSFHDGG